MMRFLLTVVLALVVVGCAPATRVILLPQADGSGAVDVYSPASKVELATAYDQAEVSSQGQVRAGHADAEQVQRKYHALLAVAPPPEQRFILYFQSGGTVLTDESQDILQSVLDMAVRQPGADIVVIGHTDRVGSLQDNDRLSMKRASTIRQQIIDRGYDARRVEAVGRGERETLIPTDDEVAEPRNRRTEIVVR